MRSASADLRLHARDGECATMWRQGESKPAVENERLLANVCRIEIAAGMQMHGWLRCGQVDASVLRHQTLAASGGVWRRLPGICKLPLRVMHSNETITTHYVLE